MTDTRAYARPAELDGLRGAAAVLVLAFTLHGPTGAGFAADLFFALSGFVLARPFLSFPHPGRALLHSGLRIARLLPLAVLGWGLTLWILPGSPGTELRAMLSGEPVTPLWWLAAELVAGSVMALAMSVLPRRVGEPADRLDRRKFVPVAAVVAGVVALVSSSSATAGAGGLGRAFLGLGLGMLAFVALDRRTSGLEPPLPFTEPAPGFPPGYGAVLATAAFGTLVARPDLVLRTHVVLPAVAAAALVWCCAQPADRWPVHRLLLSPPLQWLGARAYALFAVQGVAVAVLAPRAPSWLVVAGGAAAALTLAELVTRATSLRLPAEQMRRAREPRRRPVTPDLSSMTAAEALSLLTRPTWEGGVLTGPHPASTGLPAARPAPQRVAIPQLPAPRPEPAPAVLAHVTPEKQAEPVRPPKTIDLRSIPPELRLRPISKGDEED